MEWPPDVAIFARLMLNLEQSAKVKWSLSLLYNIADRGMVVVIKGYSLLHLLVIDNLFAYSKLQWKGQEFNF